MNRLKVISQAFLIALLVTSVAPVEADGPPKDIFGSYGRMVTQCYMPAKPDEPWDCDKKKVHDSIVLTKRPERLISLRLFLHFFNGHVCEIAAPSRWHNDRLAIIEHDLRGAPFVSCQLGVTATAGQITLHDPGGACARIYCGTRGILDGVVVPRENTKVLERHAGATPKMKNTGNE